MEMMILGYWCDVLLDLAMFYEIRDGLLAMIALGLF